MWLSLRSIQPRCVQARCSVILSILLNRLAANSLPESWRPSGHPDLATVKMAPEGEALCTPEALVAALVEEWDATVDMQVVSRITSFGLGASMHFVLLCGRGACACEAHDVDRQVFANACSQLVARATLRLTSHHRMHSAQKHHM